MTAPLFIAPSEDFAAVTSPNTELTFNEKTQRHVVKALRMRSGDVLDISDGRGTRLGCVLTDEINGVVRVHSIEREEAPRVRLVLVQALAKGGRDEMAIEESTEIGVDAVIPWQADRSIVRWAGPKEAKAAQKWESVLVAATEQSRRSWKPELLPKVTSAQLVRFSEEATRRGDLVVVLHQDATDTWAEVETLVSQMGSTGEQSVPEAPGALSAVGESSVSEGPEVSEIPASPSVYVVVGPEGGISEKEVADLVAAGAHSVVIGRNILRASTAGPVAFSLLSRVLGRW